MCLIIDRPPGVEIPEDVIDAGMTDNPHGWGLMLEDGGNILTDRGTEPEHFWEAYGMAGLGHLTVHFRWATHGTISLENCHPFEILEGQYAIVHNGVIRTPILDADRSDTWHFCEHVLTPLLRRHPRAFGGRRMQRYLEKKVGSYNKLVILRHDGARMFLNRRQGVEHDGLWLSNAQPLWALDRASRWETDWRWDDDWLEETTTLINRSA